MSLNPSQFQAVTPSFIVQATSADYALLLDPSVVAVTVTALSGIQGYLKDEAAGTPFAYVAAGGTPLTVYSGQGIFLSSVSPASFKIQPLVAPPAQLQGPKAIGHLSGNASNVGSTNANTGQTSILSRQFAVFPQGASQVQPAYAGWINSTSLEGDTNILSPLTVSWGFELGDGTIVQGTFGGANSWTLNPGATVVADPLPADIPPGGTAWIRTWIQGTTNQMPANAQTVGGTINGVTSTYHEGIKYGPSGLSDTVSDISSGSDPAFGPIAVCGKTLSGAAIPSLALVGDSIVSQSADWYIGNPAYYQSPTVPGQLCFTDQCWFSKLVRARYGSVPLQRSGYTAQKYAENETGLMRKGACRFGNVFLYEMGTNDLTGSRTFAQMQSDAVDAFAHAAAQGLTVVACTLLPTVATSQSAPHATLAFINGAGVTQSLQAYENIRQAYNAWLRSYPTNVALVLDMDGYLCPTNSGLWTPVNPIYHGAGISTTIGASSGSATFIDAGLSGLFANGALASPVDGLGPYILVVVSDTVNSANNFRHAYIWDNQGTTLTLQGTTKDGSFPCLAASVSTTLEYYIADVPTYEGLHPFPRTQSKLAAYAHSQLQGLLGA